MVVIIDRKKRTRMLLKAISRDLPHGSTTWRRMRPESLPGDGALSVVLMPVFKLPDAKRSQADPATDAVGRDPAFGSVFSTDAGRCPEPEGRR
jgi:hypothetical protein